MTNGVSVENLVVCALLSTIPKSEPGWETVTV